MSLSALIFAAVVATLCIILGVYVARYLIQRGGMKLPVLITLVLLAVLVVVAYYRLF